MCCAAVCQPPFKARRFTADGVESQYGINYLGHYHLITLLSPAFRVQPADRDVRIVVAGCSSYVLADFDISDPAFVSRPYPASQPWKVFGSSKLALLMFIREFQRSLDSYQRPDKQSNNARISLANPGFSRSPSSRNYLTLGSLWGLFFYLILWPFWWLVLKSPSQGAQTILHAIMNPDGAQGQGGKIYRECTVMTKPLPMKIANDEEISKKLFEDTATMIKDLENASALRRKNEGQTKKNGQEKIVEVPSATGSTMSGSTTSGSQKKKRSSKVTSKKT